MRPPTPYPIAAAAAAASAAATALPLLSAQPLAILLLSPSPPSGGGDGGAVYGLCVPCAVATARNRIDGSSWCVNLLCLNVCSARSIIRHGYGIKVRKYTVHAHRLRAGGLGVEMGDGGGGGGGG